MGPALGPGLRPRWVPPGPAGSRWVLLGPRNQGPVGFRLIPLGPAARERIVLLGPVVSGWVLEIEVPSGPVGSCWVLLGPAPGVLEIEVLLGPAGSRWVRFFNLEIITLLGWGGGRASGRLRVGGEV